MVDPEFLADEKTAYPIRIDPTVEFTYENNGANAIEDVTINSNGGSDGTAYSLSVGLRENYGIARTLMKFPILEHALWGVDMVITDAKVEIRDLMCEEEALDVLCYAFIGNEWTETTANWSNVSPNSYGAYLSNHTISYASGAQQPKWQTYAFDITEAAVGWWTGNLNINTGIMFMATSPVETGSTYIHKTLASYNRSAYQPSLSVTYICSDDAVEIDTDVLTSVTVPTAGSTATFRFVPASTGFYTFESSNIVSCDPYAWLYNGTFELLTTADDTDGSNFQLTYHFVEGYEYYFRAGCYGTGTGSYSVKLSQVTNPSSLNAISINWGDSVNVLCDLENPFSLYRFTPTVSGEYLFYTTESDGDPQIWLYTSTLGPLESDDDNAGDSNARLSSILHAGHTYYIVAGKYGSETSTYTLKLLKESSVAIAEGYLKNTGTSQYMDIDGPVAQEFVHQWTYHTGEQEKWVVQKQSDGYYTIRSEYGNRYYVGISSSTTWVDNVKLYASISDSTKWKIYEDSWGCAILEPKTAPGRILYVPSAGIGVELQLSFMGMSVSNRNQWKILNIGTYSARVYNYFDNGYSVYRGATHSVSSSLINGYMDKVATRYSELFDLTLVYDSASYYQSPIDICKGTVTLSNISTECTHGHTELNNVIISFRNNFSGGDTTTNALWTSHTITSTAANGDPESNRSCSYIDAIFMLECTGSLSGTLISTSILMHELNHQYGAQDHYHELNDKNDPTSCEHKSICSDCGDNPRPHTCIMNDSRIDISNTDVICSACQNDILTHLNDHH